MTETHPRVADDKVQDASTGGPRPVLIPPLTISFRVFNSADGDPIALFADGHAATHDGRTYEHTEAGRVDMSADLAHSVARTIVRRIIDDEVGKAETR